MARVASLTAALFVFVGAGHGGATSGRNLYPQLVGLKAVSVFVVSHLAELDPADVTPQVRERLMKGGLRIDERQSAPQFVVRIYSNSVREPLCPEMVSVQVVVSLEEAVRITRSPKVSGLRGTTWLTEGFPTLLPVSGAAEFAARESVAMAGSFADDVSYTTSVYAGDFAA